MQNAAHFVIFLDQTHFSRCISRAENKELHEICECLPHPSNAKCMYSCCCPRSSEILLFAACRARMLFAGSKFVCNGEGNLNDLFWRVETTLSQTSRAISGGMARKQEYVAEAFNSPWFSFVFYAACVCSFFSIKREHKSFIFKKECSAERDYCYLITNKYSILPRIRSDSIPPPPDDKTIAEELLLARDCGRKKLVPQNKSQWWNNSGKNWLATVNLW